MTIETSALIGADLLFAADAGLPALASIFLVCCVFSIWADLIACVRDGVLP